MFLGNTPELPQRVLQATRQRLEALATEHHFDVPPAAIRQGELIQPMRKRLSVDHDAKLVSIGEIA